MPTLQTLPESKVYGGSQYLTHLWFCLLVIKLPYDHGCVSHTLVAFIIEAEYALSKGMRGGGNNSRHFAVL